MKYIKIKTNHYKWYLIPLLFVANNRANYYSIEDKLSNEEFNDEVNFVMEDTFEGIDWLLNNMDFSDVRSVAIDYHDDDDELPKIENWDFDSGSDGVEIIEKSE